MDNIIYILAVKANKPYAPEPGVEDLSALLYPAQPIPERL